MLVRGVTESVQVRLLDEARSSKVAWYVENSTATKSDAITVTDHSAGTGYYYSRFRPGLGVSSSIHDSLHFEDLRPINHLLQTVLIFLTLLTAVLQNIVHRITYKSELERVRKFMLLARQAAWGSKLTGRTQAPRKVKVNIRGNPDVEGEEQEYIPGKIVEMLVQGDEVYLVCDDS